MREIWNIVQMIFAAVGGWLGYFLGGYDGFLYALIAFVVIDYLLGVMCAVLEKHLSSDVGAKGIFKKVVIFFYLSNEGISIIENATRLGLPIPEKLKDILEQLKDGGDKDGSK